MDFKAIKKLVEKMDLLNCGDYQYFGNDNLLYFTFRWIDPCAIGYPACEPYKADMVDIHTGDARDGVIRIEGD